MMQKHILDDTLSMAFDKARELGFQEGSDDFGIVVTYYVMGNQNAWDTAQRDYENQLAAVGISMSLLTQGQCFTEDTLVSTDNGYKEIKEIKIGDYVLSDNDKTGEKGYKRVRQVFVNDTEKLVCIRTGNIKINTTEKHPFYVLGKGWVYAQDLVAGDKLKQADNKVEVLEVTVKELNLPIKVYNFEVEDWHTYFVSGLNILVHNDCGRMHISNSQLGKKWGEHKLDYPELNSHQEYKSKAQSIFQNPDSIIPDHDKGEIYFIKGNDLLRIKENGDFVSLYPGANTKRVKDALKNLNK